MPKGVKGFVNGHKPSSETINKIIAANSRQIIFDCDNCGSKCSDKRSSYNKKKRHFCSNACYSEFRKTKLPKEEQHAFGHGNCPEERKKRKAARIKLNHHLRDKKLQRPPCEICGNSKSEAHHDDYDKPLDVKWLCFTHHRLYHKIGPSIYENPTLLKPTN